MDFAGYGSEILGFGSWSLVLVLLGPWILGRWPLALRLKSPIGLCATPHIFYYLARDLNKTFIRYPELSLANLAQIWFA